MFRWFYGCALAFAGVMIVHGVVALRRDRQSLQWPTVSGTMAQAEVRHHSGRRSRYDYLAATYIYRINGVRYVSHQICLWNPDLSSTSKVESFAMQHRAKSTVEVHYDPQNPGNAVLIPGADEFGNGFAIGGGGLMIVLSGLGLLRRRKEYAQLTSQCRREEAGRSRRGGAAQGTEPAKSKLSARPFLTYEPGCKRKLNCFPDEECLLDALGHGGQKIQDWKPDDRAIDFSGRVYRLVNRPNDKRYELEATGETWDWRKILDLAVHDAAVIKKDPKAIEHRVEQAADADKITAVMECVDEMPSGPLWFWIGFGLFLILFFLAVVFGTAYFYTWMGK